MDPHNYLAFGDTTALREPINHCSNGVGVRIHEDEMTCPLRSLSPEEHKTG